MLSAKQLIITNGHGNVLLKFLRKKEKEYLSAIIKPFKDKIKFIIKQFSYWDGNAYYLSICMKNENNESEEITLPYFKRETMYNNMKPKKEYTLEELGL